MKKTTLLLCFLLALGLYAQRDSSRTEFWIRLQSGVVYHNFVQPVLWENNWRLYNYYEELKPAYTYGGSFGLSWSNGLQLALDIQHFRANASGTDIPYETPSGTSNLAVLSDRWSYVQLGIRTSYSWRIAGLYSLGPDLSLGYFAFNNQRAFYDTQLVENASGMYAQYGLLNGFQLSEVFQLDLAFGFRSGLFHQYQIKTVQAATPLEVPQFFDLDHYYLQLGLRYQLPIAR